MKKIAIAAGVAFMTAASVASAQMYYPNYSYAPYSYYQSYGYPYSYNQYSSYPYAYQDYSYYPNWYNNNYGYNYGYNNYSYATPAITMLSQNTGFSGNTITIYGQGFDSANNTVYFASQSYSGIPSQNGTSLTFTIPYINYGANQTVQLSVGTSRGVSNAETFTLNPNTSYNYNYNYGCGNAWYYGSYGCGGCGYSYSYSNCSGCASSWYGCGGNTNSPQILSLNPQSGGVGAGVTIYGSGFTTSNNTVHFGNGIITGLQSPDGQSVSFSVPAQITGYGSQPVVVGAYQVSVTNGNGYTTNTIPFTVTSANSGNGAPTISYISPSAGSVGQQVTIYGSNFAPVETVNFGAGVIQNPVYSNGSSITFTIPPYVGPSCAGYLCPQYVVSVTPGTYNVSVTDQRGASNTVSFTVL